MLSWSTQCDSLHCWVYHTNCDGIGYNTRMWSRLLHIQGNLSSNHNVREVLEPKYCLSFRQFRISCFSRTMPSYLWEGLWKPFSKNDSIPTFLASTFARHIWDMVGQQLVHHGPPATTLDALQHTNCMEGHSPRDQTRSKKFAEGHPSVSYPSLRSRCINISRPYFIPCHDA